jgi:isopentenyl-diphosphate delta-isomerase
MKERKVILVTEKDEAIGIMEKMEAHKKGLLHRAFSVFIFDSKGKMLLQQRSAEKYHGSQLWSNTCCSHPSPNETIEAAAVRRLYEEMGFSTELKKIFEFIYKASVENNLIEHEYDHVLVGEYEGEININKTEVAAYYYEEMATLKQKLKTDPEKFTTWFRIAYPAIETWWQKQYKTTLNN